MIININSRRSKPLSSEQVHRLLDKCLTEDDYYYCLNNLQGTAPNPEGGKCSTGTTDKPNHDAQ